MFYVKNMQHHDILLNIYYYSQYPPKLTRNVIAPAEVTVPKFLATNCINSPGCTNIGLVKSKSNIGEVVPTCEVDPTCEVIAKVCIPTGNLLGAFAVADSVVVKDTAVCPYAKEYA